MDRFMEEHPVLLFAIVFGIAFVFGWIKISIDEKKGINSEEKEKLQKILCAVIPEYEEYTPVYAYLRRNVGNSVRCWYYAIGLTMEKMYIVPLTFAGNEIGYGDTIVIPKENLKKIDYGKLGGTVHELKFFDKNEKNILELTVEERNTKLDKTYPVNIMQADETRAFMQKIEQWSKDITSF